MKVYGVYMSFDYSVDVFIVSAENEEQALDLAWEKAAEADDEWDVSRNDAKAYRTGSWTQQGIVELSTDTPNAKRVYYNGMI